MNNKENQGRRFSLPETAVLATGVASYLGSVVTQSELLTSHGNNFGAPIFVYNIHKLRQTSVPAEAKALINGMLYFSAEIAQAVGIYPGTYDPKDFIAYGLGTGLAYGAEKLSQIRNQQAAVVVFDNQSK